MSLYPSLRWGINTLGCAELTLEETCALAARFGAEALEVRALESRTNLPDYFAEKYPPEQDLAAIAAANGRRILAVNTGFVLTRNDDRQRELLLNFARLADRLGAAALRVFGGGAWGDPLTAVEVSNARKNLRWWKGTGARCKLCLETHSALSSARTLLQFFDTVGEAVPVVWDTHHTWHYGQEALEESYRKLKPHLLYVQFKDSIDQPSARHPYTYACPGEGRFPLTELFALLQNDGFAGVVSLEWERMHHPYLPPLEEALTTAARHGFFLPQ